MGQAKTSPTQCSPDKWWVTYNPNFEISEKAQKSLIPPIRDRLHRLEMHW